MNYESIKIILVYRSNFKKSWNAYNATFYRHGLLLLLRSCVYKEDNLYRKLAGLKSCICCHGKQQHSFCFDAFQWNFKWMTQLELNVFKNTKKTDDIMKRKPEIWRHSKRVIKIIVANWKIVDSWLLRNVWWFYIAIVLLSTILIWCFIL